jgi:hypothetical protein
MTVRHRRQQPQPACRPTVAPRHVGGGPGLVDEDQAVGIERGPATDELPPLLGDVGAIPGLRRGRLCSAAWRLFF